MLARKEKLIFPYAFFLFHSFTVKTAVTRDIPGSAGVSPTMQKFLCSGLSKTNHGPLFNPVKEFWSSVVSVLPELL